MMVPPGAVPMVQPSIGTALKLQRFGAFGGSNIGASVITNTILGVP